MTKNQKSVLAYLAIYRGGAISPTEIGRQVGGPGRHSAWGSSACKRLVAMGYAERTNKGHYCITVVGHAILEAEAA